MADTKISALPSATTPLDGTEVLPIVQGGTTDKVTVANLTAGRSVNASTLTTSGVITSNGGGASYGVLVLPTNAAYGGPVQLATNQTSNTAARNWAIVSSYNAYGDLVFRISNALGGDALTAGADVLSFDTSKNMRLYAGNCTFSTAAKGVNFTANTPASGMTSQLLNWYEEGTWTPTDASGAGLTLTVANAFYTRIGRQVTVSAQVTYPTTADPSAASIGGLPFAANAGGNFSGSIENNAGLGAAYLLFGGSSAMLVKQSISILGALSNANLSTALVLVTATYII